MELNNTTTVVARIRAAVKGREAWVQFVADNSITREDIAEVARAIATLAYPKDAPVQKIDGTRTRFGNAVQAAAYNLRSVIAADDSSDDDTDKVTNLLTRAGVNATLEEVTAAWAAAQK